MPSQRVHLVSCTIIFTTRDEPDRFVVAEELIGKVFTVWFGFHSTGLRHQSKKVNNGVFKVRHQTRRFQELCMQLMLGHLEKSMKGREKNSSQLLVKGDAAFSGKNMTRDYKANVKPLRAEETACTHTHTQSM